MDKRRLLLIIFISFATALSIQEIKNRLRLSAPISAKVIAPAAAAPSIARSLRPNYPYSVIAGGAYSPAELRFANRQDPFVRRHYADFDLPSAHLVTLTENRYQYASFRQNDRIYWTRQRLLIPKGETLLTDGYHYARTRCGNRLSNQPNNDVSAAQPPERTLSLPPFSPALLKQGSIEFAPAPPLGELAQEHPVLPFDLPRLAPYLPPAAVIPESGSASVPTSTPLLPGLSAFAPSPVPGTIPFPTAPGFPSGVAPPGSTGSVPPVFPVSFHQIPPVVSEVPEPAPLDFLFLPLCILGLAIGAFLRNRRKAT